MPQQMHVVLWPFFMVAIIAEGFFFSVFDPYELSLTDSHAESTPTAIYTIGFFYFWMFLRICEHADLLSDQRPGRQT